MPIQYYLQDTNEAIIIEDKPFASGGEGNLHNILQPARLMTSVAKIFHPHKIDEERERKILYLIANPPKFDYTPEHQPIIWVDRALYDVKSKFVGFIMPKAHGEKLEILCSPKLPERLSADWQRLAFKADEAFRLRLKVCYNLAAAIHQIHATGRYVLVDLKPDNVIIKSNGLISIVDTDSIEVVEDGKTAFPATVCTPDYTPPEYYKGVKPGLTPVYDTWDRFSLAVIFYRLLLGIHPYAASAKPPYDNLAALADKIQYGLFVHDKGKKEYFSVIPPPQQGFWQLDEELRQLFMQTFDAGFENPEKRASAELWGMAFMNNPLLMIDRPLPSQALEIPDFEKRDWYEVAMEKALQDLRLTPPKPLIGANNDVAATSPVVTGGLPALVWEETKSAYRGIASGTWVLTKFMGIVLLVIVVLVIAMGIITQDSSMVDLLQYPLLLLRGIPTVLYAVLTNPLLMLIPFTPFLYGLFQSMGNQARRLSSANPNVPKIARKLPSGKRQLEERRYKLFSQRTEIKQRLREIQTELNVVETVKQKKEREFQKNNGKYVQEANQKIKKKFQTENTQIHQKDEIAKELMRAESQEIRACRLAAQQQLKNHPIYAQIIGNSPQQKIQNLSYWLNKQPNWTTEEKLAKAKELERELQQLQQAFDLQLQTIRDRYDAQHKALVSDVQQYKKQLEEVSQHAADDLRQEIKIDSNLFDSSYKSILKTRNELLSDYYKQEYILHDIGEELREIRDAIDKV